VKWREAWPGLAVSATVAVAATFLSLHYKASAMLFALLLGMALNFLAEEGRCLPGIQMASTVVLRTGVALLGLRITFSQVQALGWGTIGLIVASVALSRTMIVSLSFVPVTVSSPETVAVSRRRASIGSRSNGESPQDDVEP